MANHVEIKRPKFDIGELSSLEGKVALVTGAYAPLSIGYHVAHQLALKGAKVYVGARSLEKAEQGIKALLQENPAPSAELLHPFVADLGNYKQVQQVAQEFREKESRLDILVNNAGLLSRAFDKDSHGISVLFGTNYVGPFILTKELLPLLIKSSETNPDVRIINVSSTAHSDVAEIQYASLDDFNVLLGPVDDPYSNYFRYGHSKLAIILQTKQLQRTFDEQGIPILAISLHPGVVASNGTLEYLGSADHPLLAGSLTPFEGALTPLFAAAHPEPRAQKEQYAGSFLVPYGAIVEGSKQANDPELANQLWNTTEEILKTILA